MDIQWMLDWVAQYGLIALLFAFGFSLVGMPIPNEAIAMVAGGMAAFICGSHCRLTWSRGSE